MIQPTLVAPGFWRGPQPQTTEDWQVLQNLGVTSVLDLENGSPILKDGSPLQETLVGQQYNIRSFAMPLGEFFPPTQTELGLAVNFIVTHPMVYVHCKAGVDRTGMVCAWYRITQQGWTIHGAYLEMQKMGMHWWYYWWSWFL